MRTIEEIRQLLLELSACTGVSGDEGGIAKKIEELLRPAADCRRTPLGNVIAVQNAGAPKKLMTAAHMDEVGFLVTHIEEDGFLRVNQVGGVDRKLYASSCVTVHTASGPLSGVISSVPPHLRKEEKELPASDEVAVDLGLSGERARELVCPGDRVTIDCEPAVLLDGIAARIEEELGRPATLVVTGGLAKYVTPLCRHPLTYDPELLLKGLALLYQLNAPQQHHHPAGGRKPHGQNFRRHRPFRRERHETEAKAG